MNFPDQFLAYCTTLNLKLTSIRKEVLYILWSHHKPLKAYEILDYLHQNKLISQPPSVYRALDFFISQGVVHKAESIQSYTLCCEPIKHLHSELLMVCNNCHQIIEVHDPLVQSLVLKLAEQQSFQLTQDIIELKGICKRCQGTGFPSS
jgi:Fur family zinc uptake transcriptional regulator